MIPTRGHGKSVHRAQYIYGCCGRTRREKGRNRVRPSGEREIESERNKEKERESQRGIKGERESSIER